MTYITTVDNPWNPFTNWDEWFRYDMGQGYYTCQRLARLAPISDVLPESINNETIHEAMNQLLKLGALDKQGNYVEYKLVSNENNKQINNSEK